MIENRRAPSSLWIKKTQESFTCLDSLADFLELDEENRKKLLVSSHFKLLLPRRLAEKIEKNNVNDPLFRQFVPTLEESATTDSFCYDPVQDHQFKKTPILLQKYARRLLVISTPACAMHCRYCFRQNFDYQAQASFEPELKTIHSDPSIFEVILSGGDPLSLSNTRLKSLLSALDSIDHVKVIRFHTRFLIGIPERIDEELIELFKKIEKQIVFVLHANHPKEFDSDVLDSIKSLQKIGIPILCQTVLLKGVNDTLETLKQLCFKLIENGIIPYYLHDLDPVQGSAHFKVETEYGLNLIEELRNHIPGYGIFRYVKEIPFKGSKTPL